MPLEIRHLRAARELTPSGTGTPQRAWSITSRTPSAITAPPGAAKVRASVERRMLTSRSARVPCPNDARRWRHPWLSNTSEKQ